MRILILIYENKSLIMSVGSASANSDSKRHRRAPSMPSGSFDGIDAKMNKGSNFVKKSSLASESIPLRFDEQPKSPRFRLMLGNGYLFCCIFSCVEKILF